MASSTLFATSAGNLALTSVGSKFTTAAISGNQLAAGSLFDPGRFRPEFVLDPGFINPPIFNPPIFVPPQPPPQPPPAQPASPTASASDSASDDRGDSHRF